ILVASHQWHHKYWRGLEMIESIQIKNFRGIQSGRIDRFKKFNLLVGPNNSGKSAVLEAIYIASTSDRPARITFRQEQINYDGQTSDNDLIGYHPMARILDRHSYDVSILHSIPDEGAQIQFIESSAPLRDFDISFAPISDRAAPDQGKTLAVFKLEAKDDYPKETYDDLAQRIFGEPASLSDGLKLIYCWLPSLTYYGSDSAAWLVKGRLAPSRHTLLYDISTTSGHLPMNFFRRMIKTIPGWTQKIASQFGQVLDLREKFNVQFLPSDREQKWAQGWIAPEDRIALTIDTYGAGARAVFKAITPLIALSELANEDAPGLFIWEEPEFFQDPRTLSRLLAEVAALIKAKPIQLFIATQNLEVIANFTALAQQGKIDRDELMAFRLGLREGKLSSSWFNADNLTAWLEEGLDPRVCGDFKSPLQFGFLEEGGQ
ncbi:MAG: AAA family ATPase, partial [Blastocatellia bacterium]